MRNPLRRLLRRSRYKVLSRRAWRRRLVFAGGALIVGVACFALVTLGERTDAWFQAGLRERPWLGFLLTPLGLAATAWATRRFFPGSDGSGIPNTIAAVRLAGRSAVSGLLSLRIAFGKVLLIGTALLSGASVGVFAPAVHVGASLMHAMGRAAEVRRAEVQRALILAGGAAGIAAAFNTPLAGIVFVIEELSRSLEEKSSGLMLTAVIIAGITALALSGGESRLDTAAGALHGVRDWLAAAVLGVAGGTLGAVFAIVLLRSARALAPFARRHGVRLALGCGLVVAVCGWASGGLAHGTGFSQAAQLSAGELDPGPWYPALKMLATLASYLSGIPAGLLGPSLGIGAGLGPLFADWFPGVGVGALALLGMAAFFSGMTQTPITGFVILTEMTDNHDLLLPLMVASFVAYLASRALGRRPLYRTLAEPLLQAAEATAAGDADTARKR